MRVPYSILNQYVEVEDIDPKELVENLNTHSVEATLDYFGNTDIDRVIVGQILKTEAHPSLKKLLVCEVDIGDRKVTICTNDKTVKEGDKVFLVLPGGRIGDLQITERNFKGVVSQGMFLGLEELVGVPSEGVFKFRDETIKSGTDVKKLLGIGEPIVELDITPNRGDLLSVKGLAREISALYGRPLKDIQVPHYEVFGNDIEIDILEPDYCHRYRGTVVRNVEVKESPLWLQIALWKFGANSINNIVDITNYVLYTEGNPMHAFDLDKIEGKIYVRFAKEGEKFLALNGNEYKLSSEDLVIADDKKVLALAGVIGGLESAVSENTKNILFETAYFDPFKVRKTAKRHDIMTESSYRFERNVDIENVERTQNLAVKLTLKLAGGKVSTVVDEYVKPYRPKEVKLFLSKYRKYTGSDIEPEKAKEILNNLGLPTELEYNFGTEEIKKMLIVYLQKVKGLKVFQTFESEVDGYIAENGERLTPFLILEEEREKSNFKGKVFRYKLTEYGLEIGEETL
jgi:phenylalanyl-tRNA synthetase beta chain